MIAVRVELPTHLRALARVDGQVTVQARAPTVGDVLDALETSYPMLRGTIREHATRRRRAYMRYFADGVDISHEAPTARLPAAVAAGREPLIVLGAIAGG